MKERREEESMEAFEARLDREASRFLIMSASGGLTIMFAIVFGVWWFTQSM